MEFHQDSTSKVPGDIIIQRTSKHTKSFRRYGSDMVHLRERNDKQRSLKTEIRHYYGNSES